MRDFEKLGLLNSITEEEEKTDAQEELKDSSPLNSCKKAQTQSSESKTYSPINDTRESLSKREKPERSFELKGYIESQIEILLKVFFRIFPDFFTFFFSRIFPDFFIFFAKGDEKRK